jgi:hypothetical protein
MKPARTLGLWLTLAALLSLSCQAVTGLIMPRATATRPSPIDTATQPSPVATEAPQLGPTATPPAGTSAQAATLGSLAETRAAIQANPNEVLEALAAEQYTSSDLAQMNKTFPFTIDLPGDQAVLWEYGWCATTTAILGDNLKHITSQFFMNSQPVAVSQFYAFDSQSTDASGQAVQCHSNAVVVTHWPQGQTQLKTIVTFDAQVNDGMSTYQPGSQTFDYNVTRP